LNFKSLFFQLKRVLLSPLFVVIFLSFLVLTFSIAYLSLEKEVSEKFLGLTVLGSNMMAENYYPEGNSTIVVGETVKWYINVNNYFGSPEYFSLRLKLLNSTSQFLPIDNFSRSAPSPVSHIFELRRMTPNNSTWIIPINWTVTDVDENHTTIESLNVNGIQINGVNTRSVTGKDFMIVLELWRYDTDTRVKDFVFIWPSPTGERVTWDQIWFSLK
jgi:uncharacterized membrane protein